MNQSDEKTVYDLKRAKFNMEQKIKNAIVEFEKEYHFRVIRIDLDDTITAEVKL